MLHTTLALVCSMSVLTWTHSSAQSENHCTLKIEKDSVRAYTCENKDSKFRMVKVQFEVETTPELLAAFLSDITGYNNWQYKTINAALLQQISDNELIYYAEFVSPWPFDNRDVIVHMRIEREGSNMKIFYNGLPDFIPKKDGITRVASSASSLDIVTIAHPTDSGQAGRIYVEFKSNVDPGGHLPAFLMNQFAGEGPFESFSELRRQLNRAGAQSPVAGGR
jgi:hypothetical protein